MAVVTKNEPSTSIPMSERTGRGKRIYEALKDGAKTIKRIAEITSLPIDSIQEYIDNEDHKDDFGKKKKNGQTTYFLKNL